MAKKHKYNMKRTVKKLRRAAASTHIPPKPTPSQKEMEDATDEYLNRPVEVIDAYDDEGNLLPYQITVPNTGDKDLDKRVVEGSRKDIIRALESGKRHVLEIKGRITAGEVIPQILDFEEFKPEHIDFWLPRMTTTDWECRIRQALEHDPIWRYLWMTPSDTPQQDKDDIELFKFMILDADIDWNSACPCGCDRDNDMEFYMCPILCHFNGFGGYPGQGCENDATIIPTCIYKSLNGHSLDPKAISPGQILRDYVADFAEEEDYDTGEKLTIDEAIDKEIKEWRESLAEQPNWKKRFPEIPK